MTSPDGPFFDQLAVGDVFDSAPAVTLDQGRAAVHQSILGGRLRLSLDADLSQAVTGGRLADPAYVWDTAIGQSTPVTRRVIANLFYRGLAFHRFPEIGETLTTSTEVVGLRQNSSRPSGLAALRITTRDSRNRLVLDFWRCAMLPLSDPKVETGHVDDLSAIGAAPPLEASLNQVSTWALGEFRRPQRVHAGERWDLEAGDVVSSAPELARITLNLAHVHHDQFSRPSGRLVYGGHTIGLALAQVTRALPDLLTVAAWHSCDHTGPVFEGDTLVSSVRVVDVETIGNVDALTLRVLVEARRPEARSPVLDWRFVALQRTVD